MTTAPNTADPRRLGYVGRVPGERDSDSWYTPAVYIEAARAVFGGAIDLDPYTSPAANARIGARTIYTVDQPAPPGQEWPLSASCWMNPPYSGPLCRTACLEFVAAYRARRFEQGIVLTNNATDTQFFQHLLRHARAVCFTAGRIAFESLDGKRVSGNTRGQAFFYFGKTKSAFALHFAEFGAVLTCGAKP